MSGSERTYKVAFVVGEDSGDHLGSRLMESLSKALPGRISYCGLGGERMEEQGLRSLFDISDIAVMGLTAVLARLPLIVKRVYQTVDAVIAENPDALVIIDSPDFTHNVAKRVRKRAPHIPIIGYVSPSVWAWRPGRAKKMSVYVDELLAILPFEPDVHRKLGGPRTHYVGHPLIERLDDLRPGKGERPALNEGRKTLLVLPGSRGSEVDRLLKDFGQTIEVLEKSVLDLEILLPAVPRMEARIRAEAANWKIKPEIVTGNQAKHAAFRRAHAALAASGTVSLELAISGVPMAICYRLDWFYRRLKDINRIFPFASVSSMVLPNIILGRNVVPEFLDDEVCPEKLVPVLEQLLADTDARKEQVSAFSELDTIMRLPDGRSQSEAAAAVVMDVLQRA
ncbi:lipid-A-disaccharide synthase [Roseibium suaedae]|uniref:Lipid-A-disaccharide synthase n=1 Tax=Roseibium suaedae TaxID=735517 RepID=A0A1M7PEU7_9HYPH|nr:lipid-A-disaccharide synthase [Roseibium suaedae]SHN15568.1 lipid-A-disaccharide synthase [Roseibium suaedae]